MAEPSQSSMQPTVMQKKSFHSTFRNSLFNPIQMIQIENYRLNFLLKCKKVKRPPQSLRFSGCNALPASQRMSIISDMETKALTFAIDNLKKKIDSMKKEHSNTTTSHSKLSKNLRKSKYQHYSNKLKFYRAQESTKWKEWPVKHSKKQKKHQRERNRIDKLAKQLIDSKEVIVLTEEPIPSEAIAVLGKGIGFVKTPNTNHEQLRLDARLVTNRIASASNQVLAEQNGPKSNNQGHSNSSLHIPNYHAPKPVKDPIANIVIERIERNINHIPSPQSKIKSNLTPLEEHGYNWLIKNTSNLNIVVSVADKGGAKLIVPPTFMDQKIKEKVENPQLYKQTEIDPRPVLHEELIELWKTGKAKKYINEHVAHNVVGITTNNNKSTASHFKPGTPYFTPSIKVHKIENPEDLKPGVDIPARIITALQNGVTKRSDVYLADNILKSIEKDFCCDLVKDTTETLIWLDDINNTVDPTLKKTFKCFTFDFKNMYDSISPNLAKQAINHAISVVRKDWKPEYVQWIINLVDISMRSAIGKYNGKWYTPIDGIPTGGSISVQIANITMYYVLHECLYSNQKLSEKVHSVKRFIDDGVGIFKGSERHFQSWKDTLTKALQFYNLTIEDDAWQYAENGDFVHFLDINFGFDFDGEIITDLYKKKTDSNSYLNFHSCHPNHVFSGIVYSQALRIRRIVNDDYRLSLHLETLKEAFYKSKYPKKMVNNIINKVKTLPRNLHKQKDIDKNDNSRKIRVVSTHAGDEPLVNIINNTSEILKSSKIFSKSNIDNPYQYTKRVAPSLKSILCNSFRISNGAKFGLTQPCGKSRCLSCKLMSNNKSINLNSGKFYTAPGNCSTSMITYVAVCHLNSCKTPYVGKTVQPLNERINGHRSDYKKYIAKNGDFDVNVDLDRYAIGIHLYRKHGLSDGNCFDKYIKFSILEHCSPKHLSVKEHLWIHKTKALYPEGMNLNSPYGLPLLVP